MAQIILKLRDLEMNQAFIYFNLSKTGKIN